MFPFIVAPITGDCVRGSFLVVTIREHYSGYRVPCLFISSYLYVTPKKWLEIFLHPTNDFDTLVWKNESLGPDLWCEWFLFVYGGVSHPSFVRLTLDMRITDNLRRVTSVTCVMSPITVSHSTHTNIQNNNQRDLASADCHCGHKPRCKCVIGLGPPRCLMASLVTSRGGAGCFPNEISKIIYNLSRQDIHSALL